MSLIESTAAFEQRCDQLNPAGEIKTGLRAQGIVNFSVFWHLLLAHPNLRLQKLNWTHLLEESMVVPQQLVSWQI